MPAAAVIPAPIAYINVVAILFIFESSNVPSVFPCGASWGREVQKGLFWLILAIF